MIMQQAQFKRKIDSLERDIVGFQLTSVTANYKEMATKARNFKEIL